MQLWPPGGIVFRFWIMECLSCHRYSFLLPAGEDRRLNIDFWLGLWTKRKVSCKGCGLVTSFEMTGRFDLGRCGRRLSGNAFHSVFQCIEMKGTRTQSKLKHCRVCFESFPADKHTGDTFKYSKDVPGKQTHW